MTDTWNFRRLISEIAKDDSTCLEWCQRNGLLPTTRKCPQCVDKEMALRLDVHGLGQFRCRKDHGGRGEVMRTLAEGTWFDNHKAHPWQIMILTYCWAHNMTYDDAQREAECGRHLVSDVFWWCREVSMDALDRKYKDEGPIGGPGRVVEIDETKIGKRKYNRGRIIEGQWILGMIDLDGGFRLEICPDNKRDANTLKELILKHVKPDTTLFTDCWRGYDGIDEQGFEHWTVNHSYHWVDPETGANTQKIESNWRPLKRRLNRGGIRHDGGESMAHHMCEYLWKREVKRQNLDVFSELIKEIKVQFAGK